jgi:hypothetical protein
MVYGIQNGSIKTFDLMKRQSPVLLFLRAGAVIKGDLINHSGNEVVKGKKLENRDLEIVELFQNLPDKFRVMIEADQTGLF